ncbi:MAG: transcription-repair coupling factor [bacterium]
MNLQNIIERYSHHPHIKNGINWLNDHNQKSLYAEGLNASGRPLFFSTLQNILPSKLLLILDNAEDAAYAYNDIANSLGKENISLLPSSFRKSPKHGEHDMANEILRTDALNVLSSKKSYIVITSPEGIIERVSSQKSIKDKKLQLKVGENIDSETISEMLNKYQFEEVDFVFEPGQFSWRGSIIDIFSFTNERPYRIDLFGDTIESIRTFDIEKQLSLEQQKEVFILPNLRNIDKAQSISILNYISSDTIVCFSDYKYCVNQLDNIYDETLVKKNSIEATAELLEVLVNGEIFAKQIEPFRTIEFGKKSYLGASTTLTFSQNAQPLFHKNFDIVSESLKSYISQGYDIFICSDSVKQNDRIKAIFEERGDDIKFSAIKNTIHEGFIDNDLSICCFTDHQIFDRFHKFSLRSDVARSGKVALTLKELNQFQIGDFVVHIDHGVGRFGGLVIVDNNGRKQEVIKLIYKDDDVIFVSIHGLHRISKYKGRDGEPPRINKVGSGAWERLKERTKTKVKDIARDLIRLYAARKAEKGFQYSPDSYLQHELEASFIYEDTPDQAKSTTDIKHDMESSLPMDRLICGDVGFGKTELAVRAAFKAVTDSKQVAIMVPTTVLALQHFKTFSERLSDFPCRIEYISRAKKPAEAKRIKQQLIDGEIDILIGTHKIAGKDIKFKDLGLLVIDEEQKFGVSIKEKIKALKVNVDTLTLTATPIPRTLQFSLMGARDLSILTTPPPNRYPIATEISTYDDEIIREAITTEMQRNGQVFFINNRVQNIYLIEQKIRALVPDVRIAVAHGQMPTEQLENTIIDFINYDYDVLIATTVIESGIDIPNVNTIIINNAHMFGLSDLHQMRGRVGRSNRKAYCYLITPPLKTLSTDAQRRLRAIETFSDLGSGFSIAMQDLDIRGAGNILGAEQSGFITDLGYETYQKILNEALNELREQEFADLFADKKGNNIAFTQDCYIESDMELMLPYWYVESQSERMSLYRELDNIQNEEALSKYQERLIDRFGQLPEEAQNLLNMVRLRWLAQRYGVERLILKKEKMSGYLISNESSPFYQSPQFEQIISYCMENYRSCQILQRNEKRLFSVSSITDINQAYNTFLAIEACVPKR